MISDFSFSSVQSLSRVRLFATPRSVAPGSSVQGFSRQGYWSGLPFHSPEDLPDPGIKPSSPVSNALKTDSLLAESAGKPRGLIRVKVFSLSVVSDSL